MNTTGKVIPELKFVFWQHMFNSQYEERLWVRGMRNAFPLSDPLKPASVLRGNFHDYLERIRTLRNRIAHHEPIFSQDLARDFEVIIQLIKSRSAEAQSWMLGNQGVSEFPGMEPEFIGGPLWNPRQEEIRAAAYRIWLDEGCREGRAYENWQRTVRRFRGDRSVR